MGVDFIIEGARYSCLISSPLMSLLRSDGDEMGIDSIEELIRENQAVDARERRAIDRKPFPHPVKVVFGRHQPQTHEAFSRDISVRGISTISKFEFPPNTIATIHIHRLKGKDVAVRAELRWCLSYGEGWFLSGWNFLS